MRHVRHAAQSRARVGFATNRGLHQIDEVDDGNVLGCSQLLRALVVAI